MEIDINFDKNIIQAVLSVKIIKLFMKFLQR